MPRRADTLYPQDPEALMTVEEVGKATGRSPASILEFIRKDILPAEDHHVPGQRGRPRKMVRAKNVYLIAFRPRWGKDRVRKKTPGGVAYVGTSLPDDTPDEKEGVNAEEKG